MGKKFLDFYCVEESKIYFLNSRFVLETQLNSDDVVFLVLVTWSDIFCFICKLFQARNPVAHKQTVLLHVSFVPTAEDIKPHITISTRAIPPAACAQGSDTAWRRRA